MDDILLTVNDLTKIQRIKDCLLQQFRIKNLGDLKYFLEIEFSVFTCHTKNMCLIFCRI